MKAIISLFVLIYSCILFSQSKTCDTPEDLIEDLNTITKCSINSDSRSSRKNTSLKVSVSANKSRFLKKRNLSKVKNNVIKGKNLASTSTPSGIKKVSLTVLNTLSLEQVRKCPRFIDVDEVPAFKKCVASKGEERLNCYNQEMIGHIEKYFRYPDDAIIKKIEGEVWIRFIIDTNGDVTNVKAHAPKDKDILKEEALRVVSYLPKFIPAQKDGKNIPVKYGFPINFSLSE